jgi:flavorubredoxin
MVHWPEVMVSYESTEKVLFSADAFGKFGALNYNDDWTNEARRYYFGIVGKYGLQVQALLKKLSGYEIKFIAPLHGPVLEDEITKAVNLYSKWSSYTAEEDGVFIAYASVYGNTATAAKLLEEKLRANGVKAKSADLCRADKSECVAQAFRYSKLVLASTTYNAEIFPAMREFIDKLVERNYQNRTIAFMENGTWAPVSAKLMQAKFEKCKNLTYCDTSVKIRACLNSESEEQLNALAEELSRKNIIRRIPR